MKLIPKNNVPDDVRVIPTEWLIPLSFYPSMDSAMIKIWRMNFGPYEDHAVGYDPARIEPVIGVCPSGASIVVFVDRDRVAAEDT